MENELNLGVYLGIMLDTIGRKKKVLEEIYSVTVEQDHLIMAEEFNTDSFSATLEKKEKLINKLEELDSGFTSTYNRISDLIKDQAFEQADKIRMLQNCITEVTELSVRIQALEKKNRTGMESKQKTARQGKKKFTVNRQTADKYYKTQAGISGNNSVFIDKKN